MTRYWNKISLWLLAVFVQVSVVYPGLNGEMIIKSIEDDTFWAALINVLLAFIATRAAVLIKARPK